MKLISELLSSRRAGVFFIDRPRIRADQFNHGLPLLVSGTGNDDPVVFAAAPIATIRRVWLPENLTITHRVPPVVIDCIVENRRSHHRSLRFEHAGLDELSLSSTCLILQRRKHAER